MNNVSKSSVNIVGGGEGLEGGAAFEGGVGNRFDIARHRNILFDKGR